MPSHLNLFFVLGQALARRGHRVAFFNISDNERAIREAGFDFYSVDPDSVPPGTFTTLKHSIGNGGNYAAMRAQGRFDELRYGAVLSKGPELASRAGLDGMIVDQADACSGSVAEKLRLPWVNVASALATNVEPAVPLLLTAWGYSRSAWAVLRNRAGYKILELASIRTRQIINCHRKRWGLRPVRGTNDALSPFAQLAQQNREFDFPRARLPACFHYVGPIRPAVRPAVSFPWDRLDGRPLVYASLGTVNQQRQVFEAIPAAVAGLNVQLVLSLGGRQNAEDYRDLPGSPVVVDFAPQVDLLGRAVLSITHGGLNSTLESLSAGVPLVAVPINFDQFGVAARIRWTGTGDFISLKKLTPERLNTLVKRVLENSRYREAARRMREAIQLTNGRERAADIIEEVIRTKSSVLQPAPVSKFFTNGHHKRSATEQVRSDENEAGFG